MLRQFGRIGPLANDDDDTLAANLDPAAHGTRALFSRAAIGLAAVPAHAQEIVVIGAAEGASPCALVAAYSRCLRASWHN